MDAGFATVIASIIAAVAAITAAYVSSRAKETAKSIERNARVRQARLDERDLISSEGGFPIPIENDAMWQKYYAQRLQEVSRRDASKSVLTGYAPLTDPRVNQPIDHD